MSTEKIMQIALLKLIRGLDWILLLQELNESLEDAGNELILSDEDVVRFQIGEVFAHMPREDVEERLEKMKEEASKDLERLEEEKESLVTQMSELKKILYGKFKDSINLEEDWVGPSGASVLALSSLLHLLVGNLHALVWLVFIQELLQSKHYLPESLRTHLGEVRLVHLWFL